MTPPTMANADARKVTAGASLNATTGDQSSIPAVRSPERTNVPRRHATAAYVGVVALLLLATLASIVGGPVLGDHEALVALCSRQMRMSGDWIVPRFLDVAFVRKPPLPYWAVAATSYICPADPVTGHPVTDGAARLPSALAAIGTVLLIWRLGSAMFSRRTGLVAATIATSSLFIMLYAANATAEMLLTFTCTWAYFHFWFGTQRHHPHRGWHMLMFYVALGVGMLAKGPAPIALVAIPLAIWWYFERPLRVLARCRFQGIRRAIVCFVRHLVPKSIAVLTRLWFLPGVLIFAALFVPWLFAVAQREPHAWYIWNWQYLQRAQGDYEDTAVRGAFYYLPMAIGFLGPWLFMVFEGIAAPWMRRYSHLRRGLFYAGLWGVLGIAVMSAMAFKKPYYIGPAMPGLMLLCAVVADRVFPYLPSAQSRPWRIWVLGVVLAAGGIVAGMLWLRSHVPSSWGALTTLGIVGAIVLAIAGAVFIRGRGWLAFGLTAVASVGVFQFAWHSFDDVFSNVHKIAALDSALDEHGVPADGRVVWADQRPDARLAFYFDRRNEHLVTPAAIVQRMVDRTGGEKVLEHMAIERASKLLNSPERVYLVMDIERYEMARRYIPEAGHVIATIDADRHSRKKDWVIVSNGPRHLQ